jgi:FixJ family two-component response regulator
VELRKLVFVVDDDPATLRGVERLLRVRGFDAMLFDSAEAFLDVATPHGAVCVILDIHLKGMSGIELTHRLASSGSSLPVIIMTANDTDALRKTALDAGCIAYLCKPFSARSLLDAVSRAAA